MTQPPADILLRIERHLRMGKQQEALLLLVEYLKLNPSSARAWWLMSLTVTDIKRQMDCLERVLRLEPENELARERLEMLINQPPLSPSANPFTTLETFEVEAPSGDVLSAPVWAAPTSPVPTGPVPESENRLSTPEPAPVELPEKPPVPRKSKTQRRVAGILMTILGVCTISSLAVYTWIRLQAQIKAAQQYDQQQTLEVAQTLASLPSSTLIPTWTTSSTWTPRPTATFTTTPTLTLTLQYTLTRTPRPSGLVAPILGLFAPDFKLTDLVTDQLVMLDQFDGQPVLIFFFATTCSHCNNEIAAVESIYQTYKGAGLVLLAIDSAENVTTVEAYRSAHQLTFPILLDPNSKALSAYRVKAVPGHFFINTAGRIAYIGLGEMTFDKLKIQVDKLLLLPPTSTP